MAALPPDTQGPFRVEHGLTHEAPPEMLVVNKYQVLYELQKLRNDSRLLPRGDWCVEAAALFVAFLLALLTADFKNAFGVAGATWQAFVMILAVLAGIASIALFVWWWQVNTHHRARSPEQIVQGIIDQMAMDREKAAARQMSGTTTDI